MFGVDRKLVRSWVEQEDFYRQSQGKSDQDSAPHTPSTSTSTFPVPKSFPVSVLMATPGMQQGKRTDKPLAPNSIARFPELEKALSEWWVAQTNRGVIVKVKGLKVQALRFYEQLYPYSSDQEFKASTGWLNRFLTRMENGGAQGNNPSVLKLRGGNREEPVADPDGFLDGNRGIVPCVVPSHTNMSGQNPYIALNDEGKKRKVNAEDTDMVEWEEPVEIAGPRYMTSHDKAAIERQNEESKRFFADIRDLLSYLSRVETRLGKQNSDSLLP